MISALEILLYVVFMPFYISFLIILAYLVGIIFLTVFDITVIILDRIKFKIKSFFNKVNKEKHI